MTIAVFAVVGLVLAVGLLGPPFLAWRIECKIAAYERFVAGLRDEAAA